MPGYMKGNVRHVAFEPPAEYGGYPYMKHLYNKEAKLIGKYVDEACEKIDSPDCMLYDCYPDSVRMEKMARKITNRYCAHERKENVPYLQTLVEVILYNEILHRRTCRDCGR